MYLKSSKPTSPGRRGRIVVSREHLDQPNRNLCRELFEPLRKSGGRNNKGRLTSFRKGGGHKRTYRKIDFKRQHSQGTVRSLEYDPNRSTWIALVETPQQEFFYMLAPNGLNKGDVVESGTHVDVRVGNAMPLGSMPVGSIIHNLEKYPGKGGQMIRSAGCSGELIQKGPQRCRVRLTSGEHILAPSTCKATIGSLSNPNHKNENWGKAGRSRWLGIRPVVRGVAMNPVDHPHGGGEGKSSGGRPSVTPWGKPTRGQRTRSRSRSNAFIVQSRRG